MAVATTAVYKLIVEQTLESQQVRNVFWYRNENDLTGEGAALASEFADVMIDAWTDFTSQDLAINNIRVVEFGTENPDAVQAVNDAGDVAGDRMPVFVAAVVRLNRATKSTRDGWKRFAGIPATDVADGVLSGTTLTNFQAFAALLDDDLAPTGAGIFEPIIVNRASIDDGQLPVTYSTISSPGARSRLSTQNTRKVGRGA